MVWTISRVILTILLVPGSVAVAFAGFGLWAICSPGNSTEYGILIAAFCWLIAWVAGTVIVWRETNFEAVQRRAAVFDRHLKCPGCGYDLHGLDVPRCPECGTRFTLGELLASMIRADLL
ncbi:MAG: hypothetical protein ACE5GE_02660 [Phycisphaerae bacterium]